MRRIYEHAFERGWFQAGDIVTDPFGGVALGALHAQQRGLHWVGVELEQKFVDLGGQNIALWNDRYGPHLPGWGTAQILQGDSRELAAVLGRAAAGSVSSPPWSSVLCGGLGNSGIDWDKVHGSRWSQKPEEYGIDSANLGNLRASDADFQKCLQARDNIANSSGGSNILLCDMENREAVVFETPIPYWVFCNTFGEAMPVATICLDKQVKVGKIEIREISADLKLSDITNTRVVQQFGNLNLKGALSDWMMCKPFAGTFSATKPTIALNLAGSNHEDFSTLLTYLLTSTLPRKSNALVGTESLISRWHCLEWSPAFFTDMVGLKLCGSVTFDGTEGLFYIFDSAWRSSVLLTAICAGCNNFKPAKFSIAVRTPDTALSRKGRRSNSESDSANIAMPDGFEPAEFHTSSLPKFEEKVKSGTGVAIAGAVSSPPYAGSLANDKRPGGGIDLSKVKHPKSAKGQHFQGNMPTSYGDTSGQLAALPEGGHGAALAQGAVSSPLFESVEVCQDKVFRLNDGRKAPPQGQAGHGNASGQLGQERGTTFWTAARTIMEQLWLVLEPGAHAIFVVKSFVRKGQRVDFPNQWRELGEACGFETVEWIRAWLVEDRGAQFTLEGELDERTIERKSFFRRLAERKGSPPIDYEVVLVQRKPQQVGWDYDCP